jgi:MFS family permease
VTAREGGVAVPTPVSSATAGDHIEGVWAPRWRRVTVGMVLTVTLVAFESMAIATVMPVVADDLGGLGLYGWTFSGFFLGSLLGIVVAGELADARGTAWPFAGGLAAFAVGLAAGSAAQSMGQLVVGRVVQGVGAGAISAIAIASVGRSYPPELRPRVFAVFSTAWVVPSLIGPVAASSLAELLTWRAVFWGLLPFVAAAAVMTLPVLDRSVTAAGAGPRRQGTPRWVEALVLVTGVGLVLSGTSGPAPAVAVALVALGIGPAAWALRRLLPPGTVRFRPGMPAAVAVRGFQTFAFFGAAAFVSLAVTDARHESTWMAGVAHMAASFAWTAGSWVQQRVVLTRGPRWLVRWGLALVATGVAGLLVGLQPVPLALVIVLWALAGLGMGLSYSPLSVTVLADAAPGREGVASASLQLNDMLGQSLGTGLAGAFVALGEARDWGTGTSLVPAFALTLAVALAGAIAAGRLPVRLPRD